MTQLLYLGNNLRQEKFNPSFMQTLGPLLEAEGYRLVYSSSQSNKISRMVAMIYAVVRFKSSTHVVLIDTYSTQNFYYAFLVSQLCRLLRLSYIPILHGGNLPNRLQSHPILSQWLFHHSLVTIAPSKYLKEQFESHGYQNIRHIPNAIDIVHYPFKIRDYAAPRLLWVRSFAALYNPNMAVAVLKHLETQGIQATLCMVGPDADGSLKTVQHLAEALHVPVRFTGKLSKTEWIQLSENYNVFINTTTVDNMPVSVIEAMALGLPVVSTNVGGMPYLIEHGIHGLLVDSNDVDAMVQAIMLLFKDVEKRDEMIDNARGLAESFDWAVVKGLWGEALG